VYQIPRTKEFQGYHEYIVAFLGISLDSSIMYFIYVIARFAKVRLFYLFLGLIGLGLPPMILILSFYYLPQYQIEEEDLNERNPINKTKEEIIVEEESEKENLTFWKSLTSPALLLIYLYLINVVHNQTWMLSTLYDQVLQRSKDTSIAEWHNSLFGLLFPIVGVLSNLVYGKFVQDLRIGFIILSVLSLGFTTVRYLPNVQIQILFYMFWIPWRSCSFTFYYACFQKIKVNQSYVMTLTALGFSISGLLSMMSSVYDHLVENYFGGSFLYVNIGFDVFNLFCNAMVLIFFSKITNSTSK
jgi:hypothetical protein